MPDHSRYFDHAATTVMRPEVVEAMLPYYMNQFGNPGSLHQYGLLAKEALETARTLIAGTIGARSKELIFTGSGSESNNLAVLGAARRMRRLGRGDHVIASSVEHPSVREACHALEREGFRITFVPVDPHGRVDAEEVRKAVRSNTVLVSVMHANNVVGTLQPIAEIGGWLRQQGILFHTDAVQSYGKVPVRVDELNVDLLTINAHKIGGPKGVAGLYVRKGVRLEPIVYGGGQERGLRSATQNVAGIVGFAKAAELAVSCLPAEKDRLERLKRRLIERLLSRIPGCVINGDPDNSLPTHLNISIERIEGQALMLELDRLGFSTSSGSACSSTDSEPSYVLLAMGKSREVALESLRISMGRTTTEQSVDQLADALVQVVKGW
ncbi:cysteine desulfurase family protein [Effusibacillus lacus]|uniref:Cysteine desulfurase NifS n=1 Tax=Effusibacillus lacus TaxID=1348429 RepID=A0A292YNL1_9BACL|nr:cysteine desulfurase family protein [Effusibacillus lacus]TCS72068.1 cysteine desulfurase [Effusibacillus lacus]GAX90353.1 cysteine desulfurase NifS [Effusibacillus lacus]